MSQHDLPRGIDHFGITVPDIDAAAMFLEQALGAVPLYDVLPLGAAPMAGNKTESELGLPPGAGIVHMRLMRIGDGPSVELFRFANADQRDPAGLADYGLQHIALYVDDIEAASRRFEAAGGELLSPAHELAGVEQAPRNRGVYGRAPWGGLIELISYPDGVRGQDPTGPRRWTPPPLGSSGEAP